MGSEHRHIFKPVLYSILTLGLMVAGCAQPNTPALTCAPDGLSQADVLQFKANAFANSTKAQNQAIATALIQCVGHADPAIRDGLVFEGMTLLMRGGHLETATLKTVKSMLLAELASSDNTAANDPGFRAPFAALILAEIARVDRQSAFLSPQERTDFVKAAATYMQGITDFRGFSDTEGWRHGVAHGADWLMQLSLNPALTPDDQRGILDAVATKIAPDTHAYVFAEPERLARPVLFLTLSGDISEAEWTQWLKRISAPAPLENWAAAYKSEAGLARLHNTKAFLTALYLNASLSSNENVKVLVPGTLAALRQLP